ncbi:hypothetical protein D3C76_1616280 [compost metagenome]
MRSHIGYGLADQPLTAALPSLLLGLLRFRLLHITCLQLQLMDITLRFPFLRQLRADPGQGLFYRILIDRLQQIMVRSK